jgi:hypothetical protein
MRQNLWAKMSGQSLPTATPVRQPAAASEVESATTARLAQLKDLGALRESGVLTDEEFESEKARILG